MDVGEIALISSHLFLGALGCFLAIILWSKTRDLAWMLVVVGTITSYAQTIYSMLEDFGIGVGHEVRIGSVSLVFLLLSNLPMVFYIIAFAVMVARKTRK